MTFFLRIMTRGSILLYILIYIKICFVSSIDQIAFRIASGPKALIKMDDPKGSVYVSAHLSRDYVTWFTRMML